MKLSYFSERKLLGGKVIHKLQFLRGFEENFCELPKMTFVTDLSFWFGQYNVEMGLNELMRLHQPKITALVLDDN